MSLLLFLVFGLIVGLVARALMPGRQGMGLLTTTLIGIVGSFLGGLIGSAFGGHDVTRLHPAGIIGSIVGALVVLAIVARAGKRRMTV